MTFLIINKEKKLFMDSIFDIIDSKIYRRLINAKIIQTVGNLT